MANIDREGSYRGEIIEASVSTTKKNGLPQLVARLQAREYWNAETRTWEPWDYGQQTVGYLVLMTYGPQNQPEAVFHLDQVRKVTGWDGVSFAQLDAMNLAGMQLTFRVTERTYDNKIQLQVDWIDTADAEPRGLKKLSADELKGLDAKFRRVAKPKIAAPPPKAPLKAPPPPLERPDPTLTTPSPSETTQEAAWAAVLAACSHESSEVLAQCWYAAVGDCVDPSAPTPKEWVHIRDAVIEANTLPL